ncbi:MAG TPA: L-seryl-tRNA(Sec) selenium transferase [Synergistaceae bacterium]|nr:MAG: L-seryl-tRNA(Sec) selenium transferase [Synergistales bacterium 57_84]KUK88945.1 MAG: L-seryl-tRNA(Sec) selenium transferase [Synergistales bacterium 58_81]HBG14018.1 L-seryl-tRNA(Sec) selenium transferase [Synergistaceae bacterium]HCP07695.1 L-seryl-tRNA(Sec) selenium transferase [Synergistaceae bacterium]HCR38058.1 L-seryl-tRNA(Sec) selenium transferase [Synergistaceae bacterium]
MRDEIRSILRDLPSMDELLQKPWTDRFQEVFGREAVRSTFADVIGEVRSDLIKGRISSIDPGHIESEAMSRLEKYSRKSLRRVINATGVVVHTNLGRSCLGTGVLERVMEASGCYSNLEYDLEEGVRGHRNSHVEWLLTRITGADSALVVNNNAGAVLLCLAALGRGKEVIVSRGELVEIGGSFRIPDIMEFSGALMREVGTTNRTHLSDYLKALTPATGMILKVHPSNFRVVGFQAEVAREELAYLAREKDLIFMEDLGSGVVVDLAEWGLKGEPTVRQCIESGVDIVTFSGDKLLGGPQIGVVVGRSHLLDRIRQFPLLRALRVDKMTLAAFEATLRLYLGKKVDEIPTLRMLSQPLKELERKARNLASGIRRSTDLQAKAVATLDAVGGGAFPATGLNGFGVEVEPPEGVTDGSLLEFLRKAPVPVVASAREGKVIFHVRTMLEGDGKDVIEVLKTLTGRKGSHDREK